jgi:hypothetical protein
MSDEKLTELTGNVIAALGEQVRHLVDVGLVEPNKLRHSIEYRRELARALVEGGMSTRKTAATLNTSQSTIMRDLNQNGSESEPKRFIDRDARREQITLKNETLATVEVVEPQQTFETIVIDPPWPMAKIERDNNRGKAREGKGASRRRIVAAQNC